MPDPIQGVNTTGPVGSTTSTASVAPAKPADQTESSAPADAASATAAANAAPKADLADVGQTEALLNTILQAASTAPGIDQAKVAELQQAITTGPIRPTRRWSPKNSWSSKACWPLRGWFDEALARFFRRRDAERRRSGRPLPAPPRV